LLSRIITLSRAEKIEKDQEKKKGAGQGSLKIKKGGKKAGSGALRYVLGASSIAEVEKGGRGIQERQLGRIHSYADKKQSRWVLGRFLLSPKAGGEGGDGFCSTGDGAKTRASVLGGQKFTRRRGGEAMSGWA